MRRFEAEDYVEIVRCSVQESQVAETMRPVLLTGLTTQGCGACEGFQSSAQLVREKFMKITGTGETGREAYTGSLTTWVSVGLMIMLHD